MKRCKKCNYKNGRILNYGDGYRISCPCCSYCTNKKPTLDEAIYAWDQRVPPSTYEGICVCGAKTCFYTRMQPKTGKCGYCFKEIHNFRKIKTNWYCTKHIEFEKEPEGITDYNFGLEPGEKGR